MARKAKQEYGKRYLVDLTWPVKGIDESNPIDKQASGTTADCLNVRAYEPREGRNRGGQRPGLSKYLNSVVGTGPIQYLGQAVGVATSTAGSAGTATGAGTTSGTRYFGSGRTYIPNNSNFYLQHLEAADGREGVVVNSNSIQFINRMCPWTTDGVIYAIATTSAITQPLSINARQGAVRTSTPPSLNAILAASRLGISPPPQPPLNTVAFSEVWYRHLNFTSAVKSVLGLAIHAGVLYVFAQIDTSGNNCYVYRINPTSGYCIDGPTDQTQTVNRTPWLSGATLLAWDNSLTLQNSCMAIGTNYMGLIAHDPNTNDATLQIIALATGTSVGKFAIKAGGAYGVSDIAADPDDNFYIAYSNVAAQVYADSVAKYDSSGVQKWAVTTSTLLPTVDYDRHSGVLMVAGNAVCGTADFYATLDVSSGVVVTSGTVEAASGVECLRSDGAGNYRSTSPAGKVSAFGSDYVLDWKVSHSGYTGSNMIVGSGSAVGSGSGLHQSSTLSYRTISSIAVSQGTVTSFNNRGTIAVNSGSSALSSLTPMIFAGQYGGYVYFADGVNAKRYNVSNNTMEAWTPTAGSLPVGASNAYPRQLCVWRGRIVQTNLLDDPRNWFMSAVGNPLDWDYGIEPATETMAISGNNALCGQPADVINSLLPYNDDILIFFCDHSIWKMTGDPAAHGQLDLVTDTIGGAPGQPWCRDALGTIYFFSSQGVVYKMTPGSLPENIDSPLGNRLSDVDVAKNVIRMIWDDREQGFHLFITPLAAGAAIHYWYDARNQGWYPQSFADTDFDPFAVYTFDGDQPNDRVALLGCRDGYLRYFNPNAADDDDTAIDSYMLFGPLQLPAREGVMVTELQSQLSDGSSEIDWGVQVGETVQSAKVADALFSGTISAGRNRSQPVRAHGHAAFVRLGNNKKRETWDLEYLAAMISPTGQTRQRIF